MDEFQYRQGELWCEKVRVARIAEAIGTPAYVYSAGTLRGHFDRLAAAFEPARALICYSVKCCPNVHICRLLAERGSGFDLVSGGELFRALAAGGASAKFVMAGVGKSRDEILAAIDAGVGLFNVESEEELEVLEALVGERGVVVDAALRVNPDVDAHTHEYTTTGTRETKFGVDIERAPAVFERWGRSGRVRLRGLHLHLGSSINAVEPYVEAIHKTLATIDALRAAGHSVDVLDIGGGFGAHYRGEEAPDAAAYAAAIVPLLAGRGLRVIVEPGRAIAANAGILVTRVEYAKQSGSRRFVIVDAGMNVLLRPALYDAYHFIWPVQPGPAFEPPARANDVVLPGTEQVDVVGPVCESGDFLGKARRLPPLKRGDLVAVFSAGAYGMAMASQYNSRPRPAEALVDGEAFRLIRRRETYDDLVAAERVG